MKARQREGDADASARSFVLPVWRSVSSVIAVNMARTERDGAIYYKPGSLVEFAAQGVDVEVPWKDASSKRVTGSSFAAPKVAGMLACLLSEAPGLPPLEAKALLHRLALPWTRELLAPNQS